MADRLTFLPHPEMEPLLGDLERRLKEMAAMIDHATYTHFQDRLMEQILREGFTRAGAAEGSVWLLDENRENLVPVFNTGPNADELVGRYRQPLKAGIVSMVAVSEQSFCENRVWENADQDKTLDEKLKVLTYAMAVVPLYYASDLRGVVSCVQLFAEGENEPCGFTPDSLQQLELAVEVLSKLIDHRLLRAAIGLETDRH
jgi:hypothetical protein